MGPPISLAILPYLQGWRSNTAGSFVDFRLLVTPRGSPIDPLDGASGKAFAEADFKFAIHAIPGDDLPILVGAPLVTIDSPAPSKALPLFKELVNQLAAKQLSIDPNPPKAKRPTGSRVKKFLPLSYQDAVNYAPGKAKDLVTTGNEYSCALKMDGIATSYAPLQKPDPKVAWGQVIANLLRTPLLAEAAGLVRPFSIKIDNPDILKNGTYMFVTLGDGSPAAGGLKVYATRIPPLLPNKSRKVFSPVFFPVAAAVPAPGDYSDVFAEVEDYDDGWAKAVHCTQPKRLNQVKQTVSEDLRPVKEMGIRLGWDDEQVTIWTDRQISDSGPHSDLDVPPGTAGYGVDVRMQGTAEWHSLVRATGKYVVGSVDLGLGTVDTDLAVPINPVRPFAEPDRGIAAGGTFWLPMYYTHWNGPALVLEDELAIMLSGGKPVPDGSLKAKDPGIALTYGKTYEFQVRLMDHTGGGPKTDDPHITKGPSPIASQLFKRYILPLAPKVIKTLPDKPTLDSPLTQITVSRPLLNYPAVVCTGKTYQTNPPKSVRDMLKDDIAIAFPKREPGLPDPDVNQVVITVEAESSPHDPLATDGSFQPIFVTTRDFPSDYFQPLVLDVQWEDQPDVAKYRHGSELQTSGPLKLPRARTLRIRMAATCKFDDQYFGGEDVCTGPSIYLTARAHATSETSLFGTLTPSEQFSAYFLQPDNPTDQTAPIPETIKSIGEVAPSDTASRFASALGLRMVDLTMKAQPGKRVVFGCAAGVRGIIAPDGSSLTFATRQDLALRWLAVLRLVVNRDWTWDGFKLQAIGVERDGTSVGKITFPRVVNQEAMTVTSDDGIDPRSQTEILFIDSINPLPSPGAFPQTLKPSYVVTPLFQGTPVADPPFTISIDLPVTTPPTQAPKLASAGIAMAPYVRDTAPNYSFSEPRQKLLWLEFEQPLADNRDAYYARVLRNVPDPLILDGIREFELQPLPGLSIDPEKIRHIVQGQSNDSAGIGAMTQLIPSDESPTTRFALPLPVDANSPELFGFWTYELRVGHTKKVWSTAQGRFGSSLLVNGIQHPPPLLPVNVKREGSDITISAPYATSSIHGSVISFAYQNTSIWFTIYVQATQVDGEDSRNILLLPPIRGRRPVSNKRVILSDSWATGSFDGKSIINALLAFGFDYHAGLSVMAVEMCAVGSEVQDPLAADLGRQRILRTSGLTPVPSMC